MIVCIEREPHCAKMAFIILDFFYFFHSTSVVHRLKLLGVERNEKVPETRNQ